MCVHSLEGGRKPSLELSMAGACTSLLLNSGTVGNECLLFISYLVYGPLS